MSEEIVCIKTEAKYSDPWKEGRINISKIKGEIPREYSLTLFDCGKQVTPTKQFFPTLDLARGHATLYGFSYHSWEIVEKAFKKTN